MNENKLTEINSKFYQECDVIILPTEKANKIGSLVKCPNTGALAILNVLTYESTQPSENQHLYILSSEEIKEGDWFYDEYTKVIFQNKSIGTPGASKKIIATTDKSLINNICKCRKALNEDSDRYIGCSMDFSKCSTNHECLIKIKNGLARPSDDFIEAFVEKQGKIDKVLVEVICDKLSQCNCTDNYSCLGTKFKVASDNTITIKPIQEEKTSWNKEEVIQLFSKYQYDYAQWVLRMEDDINGKPIPIEWIEENL